MLRRILLAVASVAVLVSPAAAADKLTVLLDWYVNADHAPLVVAKQGGFFAAENLDVTLVPPPGDAAAPPRLVAAGKGDIAISYQPDLMLQVKEGLPTVRFGTLVDSPLNALMALKDGPVKSLADLKGKTIGFSITSFQNAYLEEILKSVGLTPADVKTVNLNFNLVPPLLAGQVDAIVDGFRNVELIQLELEGHPANAWYPEEHGVPAYDELIYITRNALRDDPRLPRFLAAIAAATAFIEKEPEAAFDMFVAAYPELDDELTRRSYAATLQYFPADPGALDEGRYLGFAAFLQSKGLIDTVPPLGDFAIALK